MNKIDRHVRVRPLSVNDRTHLKAVRARPIPTIPKKPKPVCPIPRKLSQAPVAKPLPTTIDVNRYKGVGKGKVLIIIGNGPSHKMAQLDALKGLPNIDTMSINKPDERLWPTTYWLFCDNSQQIRHRAYWDQYKGPIFNTPSVKDYKSNSVRLQTLHKEGFSIDVKAGVYIGNSSCYAAMQVALWMNYDKIYLFGVDMGAVGGKLYPWGSNPDVVDSVRSKRFELEAKHYQWTANNLSDEIRSKFIFCSQYNNWPFLDKYRKMSYQEAVQEIILADAKLNNGQSTNH